MKKQFLSLSLAAVVLALPGCEANHNPADGGFFQGANALVTGGYQRRLDEKNANLQSEQQRNAALQQEKRELETEQAVVSAARQNAEARLARLERDFDALDKRLTAAEAQRRLTAQQRRNLQKEVNDLRLSQRLLKNVPATEIKEKQERIRKLEARKRQLEETLSNALQ